MRDKNGDYPIKVDNYYQDYDPRGDHEYIWVNKTKGLWMIITHNQVYRDYIHTEKEVIQILLKYLNG